MEFHVNAEQFDTWITEQQKTHEIYTPKCFPGGNTFSDVDCTRYGKVNSISEIVFDQKSEYSFKEVLIPISQTLFFIFAGANGTLLMSSVRQPIMISGLLRIATPLYTHWKIRARNTAPYGFA